MVMHGGKAHQVVAEVGGFVLVAVGGDTSPLLLKRSRRFERIAGLPFLQFDVHSFRTFPIL